MLLEDQRQAIDLRNELTKLRTVEHSSKLSANRVAELESLLEELKEELAKEKKEKEFVITDRENIRKEKDEVMCLIVLSRT